MHVTLTLPMPSPGSLPRDRSFLILTALFPFCFTTALCLFRHQQHRAPVTASGMLLHSPLTCATDPHLQHPLPSRNLDQRVCAGGPVDGG